MMLCIPHSFLSEFKMASNSAAALICVEVRLLMACKSENLSFDMPASSTLDDLGNLIEQKFGVDTLPKAALNYSLKGKFFGQPSKTTIASIGLKNTDTIAVRIDCDKLPPSSSNTSDPSAFVCSK